MISGLLNVYKEKGFTSHDVVAKLRGILHQKKIGHTGTLDPDAVGVLPVCLGKATKLCDMFTEKDKTYIAVMRLGIKTDTQDISGRVLYESEVTVSSDYVEKVVMSFEGEYEQIPPMYSALKVNGRRLYEIAREGREVERTARKVNIYKIRIININLPFVKFEVSCSKGTYIRTLCDDIGEKLGCCACMYELTRTKVSKFKIEEALKLSEIERIVSENKISEHIIPIDTIFIDLKKVIVQPQFEKKLYNGNPLSTEDFLENLNGGRIRVYDTKDTFIAIYKYNEEKKSYVPEKMFIGSD